jgi:hypothetical protein
MKYVILDKRIPKKALAALKARGFFPFLLPPFGRLAAPVASHPDMLMFFGNRIFCNREYFEEAGNIISAISKTLCLPIELGDEKISSKYPNDIAYNALSVGSFIFGKLDYLAPNISEYANRAGLTAVDVRQGYAKCSVCRVSESAIITSDKSIEKAALALGLDVLLIKSGHVALDGYDCGFIGGASGVCDNTVYFCGDISKHPSAKAIISFCESKNKAPLSLSKEELCDLGSLLFFKKK